MKTQRKNPHFRLIEFMKVSHTPAIRGALVALVPAFMALLFCSYLLSNDIIGTQTFFSGDWDVVEQDLERSVRIWKGRVGFFLFIIGSSP